ncbi:MAG: Nramp family divalent metal transporter [Acidobacteriia bacterium]|nr:Nramp family divalent metal transporter [Terriglobia bacterium]
MKPPVTETYVKDGDVFTITSARQVLSGVSRKRGPARLWPFLGPAFIASIAYVDPGNFATNIEGGAKFGYTLLWVVVASNLMAILVQTLSAKLGIATGYNLGELCRLHFPRPVVWAMWIMMELVAMATDLAEFLGAALGFSLLFGMPLWLAGIPTILATLLVLALQARGFRLLEAVISAMLGVIAGCYVLETFLYRPDWHAVAFHAFVPQFSGTESVLLATGILGATIMPHVVFLHSSLTQGRIRVHDPRQRRRLLAFEVADVTIAMGVAGFVNAAMLVMAAATFHRYALGQVASLEDAYLTLQPLLGRAAGWIFAISLLASGLASATVGTMAGQVIMQGFIERRIPIWVRRLVTILPSMIVISLGLDPTRTLVISQVFLSFGLPFALVPLILFSQRRDLMGELVNRRLTSVAGWAVAGLVVALNFLLLYLTAFRG